MPDGRELTLPPNAPAMFYLQRLRDEAHRFAIGAHRQKRAKAMGTSPLDEVPGIGPARKRALLMHFGTARAVKSASLDDLKRAPGVNDSVGADGLRLFPCALSVSAHLDSVIPAKAGISDGFARDEIPAFAGMTKFSVDRLMPQLSTQAIVCSVRHHGEHGAIARLFTPDDGLVAGYVRGGRSRRVRPGADPGQSGAGGVSRAHRRSAGRAHRRADCQPRAVARRTARRRRARLGDHADRRDLARGERLSAAFTWRCRRCSTRSATHPRRAAGRRRWCGTSCCCSPNWASGSI